MKSAKTPKPLPNDGQEPTFSDDVTRQRHRLALLLGRLLARRWLCQQQGHQEQPADSPATPERQ